MIGTAQIAQTCQVQTESTEATTKSNQVHSASDFFVSAWERAFPQDSTPKLGRQKKSSKFWPSRPNQSHWNQGDNSQTTRTFPY